MSRLSAFLNGYVVPVVSLIWSHLSKTDYRGLMLRGMALAAACWKLMVPLARLAGRRILELCGDGMRLLQRHEVLPRVKQHVMARENRRYYAIGVGALLLAGWMSFVPSKEVVGGPEIEARRELVRAEFEMPVIVPVGQAVNGDPVETAFKIARALYHKSLSRLRDQLAADMVKRHEELRQRMGADGSNRSFEDFKAEFEDFNKPVRGRSHRGWILRSALVKDLRDAYWAAIDKEADIFGAEARKLLARYDEQGVTDAAKVNPLKAAVMTADHKDLLGVWRSDYDRGGKYSVWLVTIDEATATWRVDGTIGADRGSSAGLLQSGKDITFKDQKLSFQMHKVDSETRRALPVSLSAVLSVSSGMLLHEAWEEGRKVIMEPLHRSGDEAAKEMVERWATVDGRTATTVPEPDWNDPVAVWRGLAELASFSARLEGEDVTGQEELFIPVRSSVFRPSTGFMPILTGISDTGYYAQRIEEELVRYKRFLNAGSPYLKRAAAEFMSSSIARMELAQANEMYGNTSTSVLVQGQEDIVLPGIAAFISYEMDRSAERARLRSEYPGQAIEPGLESISEATLEMVGKTLRGVSGMESKGAKRAEMSALLLYDDMHQCDLAGELWETWLMPLVKQTYANVPERKLITLDTQWLPPESNNDGGGHRAARLLLHNMVTDELTNVVVAVHAENEWGEGGMQYYFIRELGASQTLNLDFALRLHKRSLRCSNKVSLHASAWCDQGQLPDFSATCLNPQPHKDVEALHRSYGENDAKYNEAGQQVGAYLRSMNCLMLDPMIQVPRLREMISSQARYTIRPGENASLQYVHFVKLEEGPNMVGVEILGEDGSPLMKDMPTIKGEIKASAQQGAIVDCEGSLRVVLKGAGPLRIIQYNDDASERWNSPLIRSYSK